MGLNQHPPTPQFIFACLLFLLALVQTASGCWSPAVELSSDPVPCMMDLRYEFQNCCQAEADFPFDVMPWVCDYEYMFWRLPHQSVERSRPSAALQGRLQRSENPTRLREVPHQRTRP